MQYRIQILRLGGGGGGVKIRGCPGSRPPPLDPLLRRTMTNLKHLIRSFAASARMKPL